MKRTLSRIGEIILQSDTEYAEFLLGITSFITGIWLFLPFCHRHFVCGIGKEVSPETLGTLLTLSGVTKFIGILRGRLTLRQLSCFIAMFVWWFISFIFIFNNSSHCALIRDPLAPIMIVLGSFNALIQFKLRLVPR